MPEKRKSVQRRKPDPIGDFRNDFYRLLALIARYVCRVIVTLIVTLSGTSSLKDVAVHTFESMAFHIRP
jgi:hypothetical protein